MPGAENERNPLAVPGAGTRTADTQSGYFAQSFSLREIAAGQASCAGGLQCHTHTTPGIRRPQETFELKSPQSALTRQNITHTILSLNVAVTGTLTRGIL